MSKTMNHIVVAGMLRDSKSKSPQQLLTHLVSVLNQMTKHDVNSIEMVIVCNKDNTYNFLASQKTCKYKLHLLLAPTQHQTNQRENVNMAHCYDIHRLKKMACLRNIYLSYIRNHPYLKTFHYLCVLDIDLVGKFDIHDHFGKSLQRLALSSLDGISCNGKLAHWKNNSLYLYADTLAFVDKLGRHASSCEKAMPLFFLWRYPKFQDDKSPELYPVQSAFGGMAIYKMVKALENTYGFCPKLPLSEHIYYHQRMNFAHDPNLRFKQQKQHSSSEVERWHHDATRLLDQHIDTIQYIELDRLLKRFGLMWMDRKKDRHKDPLKSTMNRYYTDILPATQKGWLPVDDLKNILWNHLCGIADIIQLSA